MVKKNFTRKELSNKISKRIGFSKNYSSIIVDDFFETLIHHLVKFKQIKISSFGTFQVKNKKERIGRNPKTKEEAKISSRKVVKFRPSSFFKKKINEKYLDLSEIKDRMDKGLDIIGRDEKYLFVHLDKKFPEYILNNKNNYKKWIVS